MKVKVRLVAPDTKAAHDAAFDELKSNGWREISIVEVEELLAWAGVGVDGDDNTVITDESEYLVTAYVFLG